MRPKTLCASKKFTNQVYSSSDWSFVTINYWSTKSCGLLNVVTKNTLSSIKLLKVITNEQVHPIA